MSNHHQALGFLPSREFMRSEQWGSHRFGAIFGAVCLGVAANEWLITLGVPRVVRFIGSSMISAGLCVVALGILERIARKKP